MQGRPVMPAVPCHHPGRRRWSACSSQTEIQPVSADWLISQRAGLASDLSTKQPFSHPGSARRSAIRTMQRIA